MAAVAYIVIGGFMCISSGFCTYGCYRCFTDRDERRIESEYSNKSRLKSSSRSPKGCWGSKLKTKDKTSGSTLSSFNGTIYTITSEDLGLKKNNLQHEKALNNNHDYSLSINPQLVKWTINRDDREPKAWTKTRKTKTAPI